jgi:hypothetical protein
MALPICSDPRGPAFCIDRGCPARDATGRHIVVVEKEDLGRGLQDRLGSKPLTVETPLFTDPRKLPAPQYIDNPLFDLDNEWIGGNINFYAKAPGVEPAFYAEPNQELIIAKIEGGRKRDIYIIVKGSLRVEYGKHIIRSGSKLLGIGIDSDQKLQRAISKGLISITQQPKFEAVDIRYLGRKDETRTPIGISSSNLSTVIFQIINHINEY